MPRPPGDKAGPIEIFLVAAEESGDRLGGALMRALRDRASVPLIFSGVGGREMTSAGLDSLLKIDDFSIIGFSAIPRRLPRILHHLVTTVRAVLRRRPHALVIIDSPGYTLWVARFVHWFDRSIPIIDYVSPSVWAWRPGRAKSMHGYIDHVLALLPFEPGEHQRLGGPRCSYVGHPLIKEVAKLRPNETEAMRRLLRRFLPSANGALKSTTVCMYTNTPDEHFILGYHPAHHQVLIASPCSGHGFKFSPAIGEIAARLLNEQASPFDLSLFGLGRLHALRL